MAGCWSEVETNAIEQGDLLPECEIPTLPLEAFGAQASEIEVMLQKISVIVLTQTCQIEQQKVKNAVVCRVVSVAKFNQGSEGPRGSGFWSNIRGWKDDRFHLLRPPMGSENFFDLLVVDFREIHTPSVAYLQTLTKGNRSRLVSPYVEHLSQRFGYYFTKVALPEELPLHP